MHGATMKIKTTEIWGFLGVENVDCNLQGYDSV